MKESNKKQGTSIIFVNSESRILLFLRDNITNIPYPNCWDILGGNVEQGETPAECIVREMKEEIEFEINKDQLKLFKIYQMSDRIEYTYWQLQNFIIDEINLHEGQYLRWFSEKEIISMSDSEIAFEFKSIILEFFQTAPHI